MNFFTNELPMLIEKFGRSLNNARMFIASSLYSVHIGDIISKDAFEAVGSNIRFSDIDSWPGDRKICERKGRHAIFEVKKSDSMLRDMSYGQKTLIRSLVGPNDIFFTVTGNPFEEDDAGKRWQRNIRILRDEVLARISYELLIEKLQKFSM